MRPDRLRPRPRRLRGSSRNTAPDHRLRINKTEVALGDAATRFREIFAGRRDRTLFLIGEGSVRYGEIMFVIDAAKGAGVDRVGIVTEGMRAEARR